MILKIFKNFSFLMLSKFLQLFAPLIMLPYVINKIGFENFGVLSLSLSVCNYFMNIIQYGFAITGTREIARCSNAESLDEKFSIYFSASLFLSMFTMPFVVFAYYQINVLSQSPFVYFITFFSVCFQGLFPVWYFQGVEYYDRITKLNLVSTSIYCVGVFLFVNTSSDFIYVPLVQLVASITIFIFSLYIIFIKLKVKFKIQSLHSILQVLKYGFSGFVSQFMPLLYNNSTILILGLYSSTALLGIFTSAIRITDYANSIGYLIASSFIPSLAKNNKIFNLYKKVMIGSGFVLCVLLFLVVPYIALYLNGDQSEIFEQVLYAMSISVIFIYLSLTYGEGGLLIFGFDNLIRNVRAFVSIIFFFVSLYVIPQYTIWGAVYIVVFARFFISLIQYLLFRKYAI